LSATSTNLVVGPNESGNEEFGKLLEDLRTRARMSRNAAAKLLGLSSEYLRLVEHGKRVPAQGQMPFILDIYGMNYRFLGDRRLQVGDYIVEFTSRIREARDATGASMMFDTTPTRNEQIGRIVTLLGLADDETLRGILSDLIEKTLR